MGVFASTASRTEARTMNDLFKIVNGKTVRIPQDEATAILSEWGLPRPPQQPVTREQLLVELAAIKAKIEALP